MFKISRNDADILVISNKYVDELRSLPDEKLSAIRAHIKVIASRTESSWPGLTIVEPAWQILDHYHPPGK